MVRFELQRKALIPFYGSLEKIKKGTPEGIPIDYQ
jgi:hypothetical protein